LLHIAQEPKLLGGAGYFCVYEMLRVFEKKGSKLRDDYRYKATESATLILDPPIRSPCTLLVPHPLAATPDSQLDILLIRQ
jgi:hypothetical protein